MADVRELLTQFAAGNTSAETLRGQLMNESGTLADDALWLCTRYQRGEMSEDELRHRVGELLRR
jgi:hypothetical protein